MPARTSPGEQEGARKRPTPVKPADDKSPLAEANAAATAPPAGHPDGGAEPDPNPAVTALFTDKSVADKIRKYAEFRERNIKVSRIGGNAGGSQMIDSAAEMGFLRNLLRFADWLDAGAPEAGVILTEEEKAHWRWVKDQGVFPIPKDVEAQL